MSSPSDPPSAQRAPPSVRTTCPRCGGGTHRTRVADKNPFLTKKPAREPLTCDDCGLDFDRPADSARAPWGKDT